MARSSVKEYLVDVFKIDVRSLAILRICLGCIILIDLCNRLSTLELFYTDNGIFSRQMSRDYLDGAFWSLFWINGSLWYAVLLFSVNFVAAIGLTVGFKTRWMTAICLVLAWSLQIRNPLVLTAGHILLRMLLFWSLFLPMACRWSYDSKKSGAVKSQRPMQVVSVASAAILLQLAMVYFFSGIAKLNESWLDGYALEYALHLEMYCKPFGQWLRGFPVLLTIVTYSTLFIELVGPILLFWPGIHRFARGVLLALFVLMHIGIWSTMSIGIFSMTAVAAWVLFVPSDVWSPSDSNKSNEKSFVPFRGIIHQSSAAIFLVIVVLMNIANALPPRVGENFVYGIQKLGQSTMTIQEFKMFGNPPMTSIWIEHRGKLPDGNWVDLITGEKVIPGTQPDSIYREAKTQHWRRTYWNLYAMPSSETSQIRKRMLELMSERWNREHSERPILNSQMVVYEKRIELKGTWSLPEITIWSEWPSNATSNKKSQQK